MKRVVIITAQAAHGGYNKYLAEINKLESTAIQVEKLQQERFSDDKVMD